MVVKCWGMVEDMVGFVLLMVSGVGVYMIGMMILVDGGLVCCIFD